MENYIGKKIILFDGYCNLCNSYVNFIIRKDKNNNFKFSSLQSGYGKSISEKFELPGQNYDSFLFVENERCYIKSTAALRVAKNLPGLWKMFYIFIIIPPFIRNALYDFVAKRRYKWFGKKESCLIPTPELKEKFIE